MSNNLYISTDQKVILDQFKELFFEKAHSLATGERSGDFFGEISERVEDVVDDKVNLWAEHQEDKGLYISRESREDLKNVINSNYREKISNYVLLLSSDESKESSKDDFFQMIDTLFSENDNDIISILATLFFMVAIRSNVNKDTQDLEKLVESLMDNTQDSMQGRSTMMENNFDMVGESQSIGQNNNNYGSDGGSDAPPRVENVNRTLLSPVNNAVMNVVNPSLEGDEPDMITNTVMQEQHAFLPGLGGVAGQQPAAAPRRPMASAIGRLQTLFAENRNDRVEQEQEQESSSCFKCVAGGRVIPVSYSANGTTWTEEDVTGAGWTNCGVCIEDGTDIKLRTPASAMSGCDTGDGEEWVNGRLEPDTGCSGNTEPFSNINWTDNKDKDEGNNFINILFFLLIIIVVLHLCKKYKLF